MKIVYKDEVKPNEKLTPDKLIEIILKNRQIKEKEKFLNPPHPEKINLTDFGFKRELKKTLNLLEKIRAEGKMIVVYTDYDADGITGGAILWETLHLLGFKAMPYVPHRKREGYGFSLKGIDAVKKLYHPALIISVDHGITAKDKITYAKKLGIPVVVTDHHLKPEKLPTDAVAVFHIPGLSGSGIAYIFAKAIMENFSIGIETHSHASLQNNFVSDYLSLASIGSIADLVPLLGPTRSIVKYGLAAFPKVNRIGIKHILQQAGIERRKITPYEVGFIIAPRINAVGRLQHAIDALRLLCTTKDDKAFHLAAKVGDQNKIRQDMVIKAVGEAKQMINVETHRHESLPKIIILKNKSWHEGIIGLIASKISEELFRPTIILTESDGFLKGSARSIPALHITDFLRSLKKYLIDVGGHKAAAGFTMEKKNYSNFTAEAAKTADKLLKDKELEKVIEADLKLPISTLNIDLVKDLEKLEPFGIGNPRPAFYSEVEILDVKPFGKEKNHLKLLVRDISTNKLTSGHRPLTNGYRLPIEMISFGTAAAYSSLTRGQKISIVYAPEINRWNGYENLRGKIIIISNLIENI